MSNRVAIIDLGTNTFHLAIAETGSKGFKILYQERQPVKIGMGGINQGIITDAGMERAIVALQSFQETISTFRPARVLAFGTSALRSAKNNAEVIAQIKSKTGIECQIISGEEEALYIYLGVRAAIDMGKEKSLIVDIGGGSVEFIIGNDQGIFWKRSFEIGAQRLLEKFQKHDPITVEEVEHVNAYFTAELIPLFEALKNYPATTLVGSSGTFDTLSDIYCIREGYTPEVTPETPLTIQAFQEIYEELLQKNRAERLLIPGMIELRVDMIVVACGLIDFLIKHIGFQKIRVSSYSLKEGVLASFS